jgi:hypothetical protein
VTSLPLQRRVLSCFARALDRYIIDGTTVGRCLLAVLGHAIFAEDGSDAQTIVAENALAAGLFIPFALSNPAEINVYVAFQPVQSPDCRGIFVVNYPPKETHTTH